jgi:response regulator of citrate/malate metabolism
MAAEDLKFMIVEDSVELCTIWKHLFNLVGYHPVICHTGEEATKCLNEGFEPELVMTDYFLPDITGIDLIQEIKNRNISPRFIMVTGNRDDDFCETILRRDSSVTILHKPVKFAELKEEVNRLSS